MHEIAHTKNASITHARQKKFFLQEQVSAAIFSKGHKRQKGPAPFGRADRSCRPNVADRSCRPSVAEPTVPTAEADRNKSLGHLMFSVGSIAGSHEPSRTSFESGCGPCIGLKVGPKTGFILEPLFRGRYKRNQQLGFAYAVREITVLF